MKHVALVILKSGAFSFFEFLSLFVSPVFRFDTSLSRLILRW
jgi:hypothetical protein